MFNGQGSRLVRTRDISFIASRAAERLSPARVFVNRPQPKSTAEHK